MRTGGRALSRDSECKVPQRISVSRRPSAGSPEQRSQGSREPRCHAAVQETDESARQLQEAPAGASAPAVPTALNSAAAQQRQSGAVGRRAVALSSILLKLLASQQLHKDRTVCLQPSGHMQ